jgi:hypothetical protein
MRKRFNSHSTSIPYSILLFVVLTLGTLIYVNVSSTAQAAPVVGFEAGRIIDDDVFTASGSMTSGTIQTFLNSKVPSCDTWGTQPSEFGGGTRAQWGTARGTPPPYVCLRDYSENGKSAAQIIYDAAQEFQINPQVLIVLLQKEQGLVTDTWPLPVQYRTATGYGCPDTAPCDSQYYGLTNQLRWSGRMFRAIMNNSPNWYTPYVLGNNYVQWNPSSSCGGSTVNIANRSTQALYNYTPYQPNQSALNAGYGMGDSCGAYGNRNFYLYFNDWFGSTKGNAYYTCKYGANIQGAITGQKVLRNRSSSTTDNISLVVPNNTNTKCVEVHTWANNQLQSWSQHIGTNSYTFDPAYSRVVSAKISKSNTRLYKIDYMGTSSGRVEVHGWTSDVQHWNSHIATNAGLIDPTLSEIVTADTNGDGMDEFFLVNYSGTNSGKVEVHGWSQDFQRWVSHYATNLPTIDPAKGRVLTADLNADGKDEFIYVKADNAESGSVEFHSWTPNFQQWTRHVASNYPAAAYNRTSDDILVADIDGNGRDNLLYVKYSNTGSGRVEVHGWSDNQQYWTSHIATSSGSY